jgi:hypothetical protein
MLALLDTMSITRILLRVLQHMAEKPKSVSTFLDQIESHRSEGASIRVPYFRFCLFFNLIQFQIELPDGENGNRADIHQGKELL